METPIVLSGKLHATQIKDEINLKLPALHSDTRRAPGLAVILVGDNPASATYVASKEKFAKECGFITINKHLSKDVGQIELLKVIASLNQDPNVDGILLQLPLPPGYSEEEALLTIDPKKDADGLHPYNQGLLMRKSPGPKPCTPLACVLLIDSALRSLNQKFEGKRALVIGRSVLVGTPLSLLLTERNATVTVAHSKTDDIPALARQSDILVAALGKPGFITRDYIKPGAIVIDVGITKVAPKKVVGDVAYDEVAPLCAAITPVPGGVGPLTVAMLIKNTFEAYRRNLNV